MSTAVLFYLRYHDREGIVPVDTFVYPSTTPSNYLQLVNWYLNKTLQKFVERTNFWVTDKKEYRPNADEGYGRVYAEQQANNRTALSTNPYKAAVTIITTLLKSETWEWDVVLNSDYTVTGYTMEDIPTEPPVIAVEPPVDNRYVAGDVVVNRKDGSRYTYTGVLHDPFNEHLDEQSEINRKDNTVRIGVNNKNWVKETDLVDFMRNRKFALHPMPKIAERVTRNKKWFALTSDSKEEGYGRTQKEAKELLALKIM